jgi:phosphoglycolate phosphatase
MNAPFLPQRLAAVLFDLDGTLIDSVPDITEAVAELMQTDSLPRFSEPEVRKMVGLGVEVLVERAYRARGIEMDEAFRGERLSRMLAIYPRHLVGKTTLMPGAEAAMGYLDGLGVRMGVVTNKPLGPTIEILDYFGMGKRFALVIGDRPAGDPRALKRKPAPDMILHAVAELDVPLDGAIMVGDSGTDIGAAKNAGVFAIAVRGGYTPEPIESYGPDLVIDTLADLPAALSRPL